MIKLFRKLITINKTGLAIPLYCIVFILHRLVRYEADKKTEKEVFLELELLYCLHFFSVCE